jgi:ABC-type Fe3+ transport system substrate-binding protein
MSLRIGLLLACLLVSQQAAPQPALYEGPAREQRLLEGARREGARLTYYTSMAERDTQRLVGAFEARYGIKVSTWRSGKNKVLQRVVSEARARRTEASVVLNPSPEMEALRQERLLQPVRSPHAAQLIAAAVPAHGEWVGVRVYVFVQPYNTKLVQRDELPARFEDLLHPRWKGRLGIEGKEQEWFYTLLQTMGEDRGLRFFKQLATTNGLSVRLGNSLLVNMVSSGEVPFALTAYSYLVEQAKAAGAPVDYIALQPTIAYTDGIGLLKDGPHPHAAALFHDFMLSEGQALLRAAHHLTTRRNEEDRAARFAPVFIDPVRVLDDYDKWGRLFEAAISGR